MKTLLLLFALLLAGIAGFGFYQGWFYFSANMTDHTFSGTLSADQDKIRADEHKAKKMVNQLWQKTKATTTDHADKVNEPERRP